MAADRMTPAPEVLAETVAEEVAAACEESGRFLSVDWNDLGEVTIRVTGRTFRATFYDITDEED